MFIYLVLLSFVATAFASEEVLIAKDNSEYLKLQYIQPQSDEDVRFRLFMHLESNLDLLQTATSVCMKKSCDQCEGDLENDTKEAFGFQFLCAVKDGCEYNYQLNVVFYASRLEGKFCLCHS